MLYSNQHRKLIMKTSTNIYILNGNVESIFHPKIKMKVFDSFVNIGKSDICVTISNELIDFISSSLRFAACFDNKNKRDDFVRHINETLNSETETGSVVDELDKNIICSTAEKENEVKILNDMNNVVFENINDIIKNINNNNDKLKRPYHVMVKLNADENNFDILFLKPDNFGSLLFLKCEFIN